MDITAENEALFTSLMSLIRSTNSLYSLDVGFVRSIDRKLSERSQGLSNHMLNLINQLLSKIEKSKASNPLSFSSSEDLIAKWSSLEQSLELLFDKIDSPVASLQAPPSAKKRRLEYNPPKDRPQDHFTTKVDNSFGPFKPLLIQKPHAIKPLKESLAIQPADEYHEMEWYEQPYKTEIMTSKYPPPTTTPPVRPDWQSTNLTLVDTPSALLKMVNKLKKAKEVAVDVEHHEKRTYLGLTCLIQISALGEDYIIDTLALRSEMQMLNQVFTDPKILKILHGSRMDIVWLQRDLGLYIVSLFDTFIAAKQLGLPKLSLAYLLTNYADFTAQKQYQLSDWRERPLSSEMLDYARGDTHFLLYVYHQLRDKLLENKIYDQVCESSRKIACVRYEKPHYNESEPGWVSFANKYHIHGHIQRACLLELYKWRDSIARELDESPTYIFHPQVLANFCITRPETEEQASRLITRRCPVLWAKLDEVLEIVKRVNADPNAIDTSVPIRAHSQIHTDPVVSTQQYKETTPPTSNIQISQTSKLFGTSLNNLNSSQKSVPALDLGIVKTSDLERAQKFMQEYDQQAAEVDLPPEPEPEPEPEPDLDYDDMQIDSKPSKGKKLNIVSQKDASKIEPSVRTIKSMKPQRRLEDEPAFDFEQASKVIGNTLSNQSNSFSQFGKSERGPKGFKKQSKFKRAGTMRR